MTRDFTGYGRNPPNITWPNRAGLAVMVVLNIEEGAELSIADGDERNESVHEVEQQVVGAPDYCLASHFEYGTRVAYWRIKRVAEDAGVPLVFNACTRALEASPWIAQDAVASGYELCCHGYRWESHAGMDEAHEREVIKRAVAGIVRVSGQAPAGWHTKSSSSVNTRRLLLEHGGFLYDADAYNDDLPYYVEVAGRPHLVVPYAFDTNDMRFYKPYSFVRAQDFADYTIDAFDELLRESKHVPKMLSIGLHLRIIGRAARIGALRTILKHIQSASGVWITRRDALARYWLDAVRP